MPQRPPFAPCQFLPYSQRENLPEDAVVYDVSSHGAEPYCTLSPFWVHGGIPIPGLSGKTSDTVEGIWQGLKVIRGKTAPWLFRGPGRKRGGGKPRGHQFGERLLDYVEARRKIYIPAYEWMLANRADPDLIEQFIEAACRGITQHFHDLSDNGNLHNIDEALAHASVLVRYLNRQCAARMAE